MGTDKTDFEIWLKSKWDGDAMKAAEADFRKTQKAVKETDTSMRDMGYSADALKKQLLSLVAFAEVVAQFKEGFEQVAALEQAMNQLERAAERNGDSFDEVKKKFIGFADALKKAAGVDDDAAIRAMTDLYAATGNVENSMNLVKLATDVSIGANMEFTKALDLVTGAAQGKTRALVQLKLAKDEDSAATLTAKEALDRIVKVYGGATEGAKGLKVEINKLSEAWEDLRNNVVEKVSPALYILIKAFNSAAAYWSYLYDLITTNAPNLGAVVMGSMRGLWEGIKGNTASAEAEWAHVLAISNTNASRVATIGENLKKKLAGIWGDAEDRPDTKRDAPDPTGGPKDPDGKKTKNNEVYENEKQRQDQILKAEAERLKAAIEEYKEYLTAKKALDKRDASETIRIGKEIDAERERLMDAQTKRILDEVKLRKAAAEAEKAMALEVANASLALAGQLFGDSKELAIASAIINTYEGATKALGQGGIYGPVLAAIVIASGLAQVAKIVSTKPATEGAGFDDPGNDAAARIGGRRWAADMIGEFTAGASQGWAQGMRASGGNSTTTNDNRRTFNVHMHGAGFIDPNNIQMMKQFKRTLDVIETTVEGQRRTARTAR